MSVDTPAIGQKSVLRQPMRLLTSVLSLRFLALRISTAGAAVAFGLVQTFVFARVLSSQNFSLYILVGTFGLSLWLFDLGAAKILYVRQRELYLAGNMDGTVPAQTAAVVIAYTALVAIGTLACLAVMLAQPQVSFTGALQFALFFSFAALNLVWHPLRNVSSAVDEFVHFESLEATRRLGHIGLMLAMLIGLPFAAFLVLANALWFALFALAIARLVNKKAFVLALRGAWSSLKRFWHDNRRSLLRSGNYAAGELTIYNFPYMIVPAAFGLGAPTIILDTVFKVFRGATLVYAAGLDPLVPQQTRAYAAGDVKTLKKATLTAAVLCAIPTFIICLLLLAAGDRLFALLLGGSATVPREATYILVVLLIANLVQNVANSLLLHLGFFHEMARVATFLVIAMAAMTGVVLVAHLDITGFIAGYAVVYLAGAALYIAYVFRGPFRTAAKGSRDAV
jgi:O-antigen/teichoic acid export membrane protein